MTFLGWLSDPFKWYWYDLQLEDEKVTLNHLVFDHSICFHHASSTCHPVLRPIQHPKFQSLGAVHGVAGACVTWSVYPPELDAPCMAFGATGPVSDVSDGWKSAVSRTATNRELLCVSSLGR